MTGNTESLRSWQYQGAVGTAAITTAAQATYFFGKPDKSIRWKMPSMKTPVSEYGSYDSREKTLTPQDPQYQPFPVSFIPTTPHYLIWMLKQVEEDGIGANVHKISCLDSGLPLPITIRNELTGGSVDRIFQTVDNYCVGMSFTGGYDQPLLVSCDFMFGRLEDRRGQWKADDTISAVDGATVTLTDEPQRAADYYNGWLLYVSGGDQEDQEFTIDDSDASDPPVLTLDSAPNANINGDSVKLFNKERPILTTKPVMPGESAVNPYLGRPEVYWDVGDQNVQLTECQMVTGQHRQKYGTYLDTDSKYQIVYLYSHEPVYFTLECILERHKQVYDYIDRKANQVNVTFYKPNTSYYVQHQYYGCNIVDYIEEGPPNLDHYIAKIILQAESTIGAFTLESEDNWGTHYREVT